VGDRGTVLVMFCMGGQGCFRLGFGVVTDRGREQFRGWFRWG